MEDGDEAGTMRRCGKGWVFNWKNKKNQMISFKILVCSKANESGTSGGVEGGRKSTGEDSKVVKKMK